MFRVLSDIHLDSGSVRIISITRNTTKHDPFGVYVGFGSVRIYFYRNSVLLSGSVYLPSPSHCYTIDVF